MRSSSLSRVGGLTGAAFATLLLLLGASPASAQEGAVTGQVVKASDGQPLSGAQVLIRGTNLGTLTGDDGTYRITGVPVGGQTVVVRVIGYERASKNVQVQSGQAATADFRMAVSAVSLDEIVVTQTGEQQRRSLTTNVTTIDAAQEVENAGPVNMQGLIQGRSPGVVIQSTSGSVGSGTNFTIRGASSISQDNTPIIYIDGVRVSNANAGLGGQTSGNFFTGGQQTSRLSDLDPSNIESIQILKGPSATTLYGSQAASGVIRITTKEGGGEPQWQVTAEAGGNWDSHNYRSVTYNPTAAPLAQLGAAANDTLYMMNLLEGRGPGIEGPFRTGVTQEYTVTTQGGFQDGQVNYFVQGAYENREGNLPANFVRGFNVRGNVGWSAQDFTIQLSNGYVGNTTLLPQNDNNGDGYLGTSLLGLPFFTPFQKNGVETCPLAAELADLGLGPLEGLSESQCSSPFLARNFEQSALEDVTEQVQRYTGSINATYRPFGFLTARATAGLDINASENRTLVPVRPDLIGLDNEFRGTVEKQNNNQKTLTLRSSVTSSFNLTENLANETTLGGEFVEEQQDAVFISGTNFPAGSPTVDNSVNNDVDDFFVEQRTLSGFAETQFDWKSKIFVNGGLRVDEGSAFGQALGGQFYPRVGGSYVISEEDWFPSLFEQFKLRVSWGQSGKQPGTNDALALLSTESVPFQGEELLAVSPQRPGNPTLEPERDSEWEAGADFSLLRGRLSGSFTWYKQIASDAIVSRPLSPSLGFPGDQITNIGELENTGIEASLNATAFSLPDLEWSWSLQASTNISEITELQSPIDVGFGQRHAEGREFGAYFGRPVVERGGEFVVADTTTFLEEKTPSPNLSGSVASTLTLFNQVTLYALADVATGRHLADNTESFMCWFLGTCAAAFEKGPDGQLTDRAARIRAQSQARVDSESIWAADYVKLRTATVRWRLPQRWTNWFGVNQANLRLTGNNLMTWTPYPGADPELNNFGSGADAGAAEFLTLPPSRSVTAELTLRF